MSLTRRLRIARGEEPADLVLRNARIVNVLSREIHSADVVVADGRVVTIGGGTLQIDRVAVAPLFDQAGRLAGAVNITSCREDLERAAHQLALAVTMEATRRMEGAIFRDHFRNAWIATVPGDGGSGLRLERSPERDNKGVRAIPPLAESL